MIELRAIHWPVASLLVSWLNNRTTHVVATLGAYRVGRDRVAALGAVTDLTLLQTVVATSFSGSTVAMFSLRDSHGCFTGVKMESYLFEFGPAS